MTIQDATALVGHSMGLGADFDGSTAAVNALDIDTKQALTSALGAYIRNHPEMFTAQNVSVANTMATQPNLGAPMADPAFNLGDFFSQAASNGVALVGEPLAAIGTNVSTAVSMVAKLIPFIVLAALALVAWPYIQKARQPAKPAST